VAGELIVARTLIRHSVGDCGRRWGKYVEVFRHAHSDARCSRSTFYEPPKLAYRADIGRYPRGKAGRSEGSLQTIEGAAECIATRQRVQSLDINPVIVMDQGQGCVAVDSVVVSAQPERA